MPGSVNSGSVSWDNCGRKFPDKLRVSLFLERFPHYACTAAQSAHSDFVGLRVYVCLGVTCHLHFWQNDQGLLHATAVTWGWNRHRISQHTKWKFSCHSCWDSNSQPFHHKSGALTNKLSRLLEFVVILKVKMRSVYRSNQQQQQKGWGGFCNMEFCIPIWGLPSMVYPFRPQAQIGFPDSEQGRVKYTFDKGICINIATYVIWGTNLHDLFILLPFKPCIKHSRWLQIHVNVLLSFYHISLQMYT